MWHAEQTEELLNKINKWDSPCTKEEKQILNEALDMYIRVNRIRHLQTMVRGDAMRAIGSDGSSFIFSRDDALLIADCLDASVSYMTENASNRIKQRNEKGGNPFGRKPI